MSCAFAAMLVINMFSLNFSSIALMIIAAIASFSVFAVKGSGENDLFRFDSGVFEGRLLCL